eukprot:12251801-Prorocentrum_lima.AAC.1
MNASSCSSYCTCQAAPWLCSDLLLGTRVQTKKWESECGLCRVGVGNPWQCGHGQQVATGTKETTEAGGDQHGEWGSLQAARG